jgi:hypothetical protein
VTFTRQGTPTQPTIQLESLAPTLVFEHTGGSADQSKWQFHAGPVDGEFRFVGLNDDNTADTNFIRFFMDGDGGANGTSTMSFNAKGNTTFQHSANTVLLLTDAEVRIFNPLRIRERAAALSPAPALGQLWVKNTTPCQLWFTDDAGNDTQIV